MDTNSNYIREIENVEWVQELLMERFGNATELVTSNSIIYGGAIRDCIAGKELIGDLDFSVPLSEFNIVINSFLVNTKWIPTSGLTGYTTDDQYQDNASIENISSFKHMGGGIVQLVAASETRDSALESAINVARQVDIICCGIVMLSDGRIFETVPGAYEDCIKGILRINPNHKAVKVETIRRRVEKLQNRGWTNTIDIEKVIKAVNAAKIKEEKKRQKLMKQTSINNQGKKISVLKEFVMSHGIDEEFIIPHGTDKSLPKKGGFTSQITAHDVNKLFGGDLNVCLNAFNACAATLGTTIEIKISPLGNIFYTTKNRLVSDRVYEYLLTNNKPKTKVHFITHSSTTS